MLSSGNAAGNDPFIRVNVSGTAYRLLRKIVAQHPFTRLGKLAAVVVDEAAAQLCDHYTAEQQEFYFARSPTMFEQIVSYYNTGILHAPHPYTVCTRRFMDELRYWDIEGVTIAPCCIDYVVSQPRDRFLVDESPEFNNNSMNLLLSKQTPDTDRPILRRSNRQLTIRQWLWSVVDRPTNNIASKIFAAWSLVVLTLSTLLIVLSSYPEFYPVQKMNVSIANSTRTNITNQLPWDKDEQVYRKQTTLLVLHNICTAWFSLELLLRLYAAPKRLLFLRQKLTLLTILSLLPYYMFLSITYAHVIDEFETIHRVMFALRMLQMFQLFRLAQYSQSFRLILKTLSTTQAELCFLLSTILILVLLLSTVAYFIESNDPRSPIQNIPIAMYWCLITITTVGYGDVTPTTQLGRVFTCAMTILSIVTLSLPVSVIVAKFTKMYEEDNKTEPKKYIRKDVSGLSNNTEN